MAIKWRTALVNPPVNMTMQMTFSRFCQNLKVSIDQYFSICGDVVPVVFAQRWVDRLRETHLCLGRVFRNVRVPTSAQRTIEEFTNMAHGNS